ncbi:uncharacterized protein DS421_9g257580 [Arachis hypogaea]|nr:extensin-like isoform X1 [Arachis hypogaea]QHO33356.1 uncharacterized protein DS421_9g257580 [Arachis hypogaea]
MINPKLYLPFILLFIFHLFSHVLTRKISEGGFMVYPMGLKPIPVPTPGSPPPRPPPPPPDWPPPRRRRGPPPRRRPGPPPRPNLLPYHTDLLGYHSNAFQGIKKNPMYTSHLVGYYPYYDYQPYIPFLVPSTTSNHYTHTSTPPALISMQDTIGVEYFDKDVGNNFFKHPTLLKDLERGQRHDPAYVVRDDPSYYYQGGIMVYPMEIEPIPTVPYPNPEHSSPIPTILISPPSLPRHLPVVVVILVGYEKLKKKKT